MASVEERIGWLVTGARQVRIGRMADGALFVQLVEVREEDGAETVIAAGAGGLAEALSEVAVQEDDGGPPDDCFLEMAIEARRDEYVGSREEAEDRYYESMEGFVGEEG